MNCAGRGIENSNADGVAAIMSDLDGSDSVSSSSALRDPAAQRGYRHEALVYAGMEEFLQGTLGFLLDGIVAGDPTLVVVSQEVCGSPISSAI
jgi:hypothetical protein